MTTSPRCLIFDLDGTLVDSEPACNQAFLDLIPDLDLQLEELVRRYRGRKLATIIDDIETHLGSTLPPDFIAAYRARVAVLFEDQLLPMPNAAETLAALTCPICVASSAPVSKITHALRLTGLEPYFAGQMYSSYEVGHWKPHPGLFLHVAEAMGFQPADCAVVDDSEVGIQAAVAAGMAAYQFIPDGGPLEPGATPISDLKDLLRLFPAAG
ncbi:HAD-IA family hydrolase [Iodidimonas sp. SYSU 1G8]|uniref:HAD-IA family hydrolase n=1 Tax=Iodidimonas sp. SYSU 1G8 TaxID=3133967 RepID=UPI0031FECDF3